MTPNKFESTMRTIREKNENDPEVCHILMDDCLCETLRELGYDKGVDIFESTDKWYS